MEFYKYHFQQQAETGLVGSGGGRQRDQLEGDPKGARKGFKLGLVHGGEGKEVFLA